MNAVYEGAERPRFGGSRLGTLALVASLALAATPARAQSIPLPPANPELVLGARDAVQARDRVRLQQLLIQAQALQHPLTPWIAYWEIGQRLTEASPTDLEDFYRRYAGSYVEDRLRNDWLLELGRRHDWANFAKDYPRFRMNDDREVSCYALLAESPKAPRQRERARALWMAQRDGDDGCALMASTLRDAKQLSDADVWTKLRLSVEFNKPRAVKQSAALLDKSTEKSVAELMDNAPRYLARKGGSSGRLRAELSTLAVIRLASTDPAQAAEQLQARWAQQLPQELAAWAWAQVAKQSAFRLAPEAPDQFEHALKLQGKSTNPDWSEDSWNWAARAALRADQAQGRWPLLLAATQVLQGFEQREPVWTYWRARAQLATAAAGAAGEEQRRQARQQLQGIADPLHFYGQLAAEDLGLQLPLPPRPAPLTAEEKALAFVHPGLNRALALLSLGLRSEGVREWNYSLRGMGDRELLAAAQLACDREVWDRCIAASERTRSEIDVRQRYPLPLLADLQGKSRELSLDLPSLYGLIRQESRFVTDARSHVGAAGLMQVMPATAKWTAKKLGFDYRPELLNERDFNLRVGGGYLKLLVDDFGGSLPLAAAAYNAGPNRPRRWRDGPSMDAAVWSENVPFNETRDYVKRVLANATVYARLLGDARTSLRDRLGPLVGPREASAPQANTDLP